MLSFNACDSMQNDANSSVSDEVKFILREDVIELNTAAIRVRHTSSADVMWVYMQTEDLESDADALIASRVENEYNFTDQIVAYQGTNKSVHFYGLEAKKYYRVIVKAIDDDGKLYGKAASLIFKTRRNPDLWEENLNWTLGRKDERSSKVVTGSTEVQEYENFDCKSNDQEPYIVLVLSKKDYQDYKKDDDHKDVKRTLFEDYHSDFIKGTDYKSRILKGNNIWEEERLRSGEYVAFMIGLDEDNELSGLYRQFNVTIDKEEATEKYDDWKGTWTISFADGTAPWTIYIDEDDPNMWLTSKGWEPEALDAATIVNMPLKLYFCKSTGDIYFISQQVDVAVDGEILYYYGTFPYGTYQTVLDTENIRLAKASFTNLESSKALIEGQSVNLQGVGEVTFTNAVYYIRYDSTTASGASPAQAVPSYPWTMEKVQSNNAE